MDNREVAGVRRAITWLHDEAEKMNDVHAQIVLNNAAFHLGVELSKWRAGPTTTTMANIINANGRNDHTIDE